MPADQPPSMIAGLHWPVDVAPQARPGWVSRDSLARCDGSVRARVGDEVQLHFAREQLKWFDASTGLAQ